MDKNNKFVATDDEGFFDELRRFIKKQQADIAEKYESHPLKNREIILTELSHVAEHVIEMANNRAPQALIRNYGLPLYEASFGGEQPADMAIVGMGKLGAQELSYQSDLDVIFIYSHVGETRGAMPLSNAEYFVKYAQRLIHILTVQTPAGRGYAIDTELRPSGNKGTLVSSYDHFLDHQMNHAQYWERQALLRARVLTGEKPFKTLCQNQIDELAFTRPMPADFAPTMHAIRHRVLIEKVHEDETCFDLKRGHGSVMDIEFIVHFLQLRHSRIFRDLRVRPLYEALRRLESHQLLPHQEAKTLTEAYTLYRSLECHLQLIKNRPESMVQFESEEFSQMREKLGFAHDPDLKEAIASYRLAVKNTYQRVFAIES
jgi:glutamate-ammonia-ligase adenylyltransferase